MAEKNGVASYDFAGDSTLTLDQRIGLELERDRLAAQTGTEPTAAQVIASYTGQLTGRLQEVGKIED